MLSDDGRIARRAALSSAVRSTLLWSAWLAVVEHLRLGRSTRLGSVAHELQKQSVWSAISAGAEEGCVRGQDAPEVRPACRCLEAVETAAGATRRPNRFEHLEEKDEIERMEVGKSKQ